MLWLWLPFLAFPAVRVVRWASADTGSSSRGIRRIGKAQPAPSLGVLLSSPKIHLHRGDLPAGLDFGASVAVDSETMGLNLQRDRLCLVQLSSGNNVCHLVQFAKGDYDAPNLKRLLADRDVTKLFHFARFDVAVLFHYLKVHRPARAQGSMSGSVGNRDFQATAKLRLGCRCPDP